MCYLKLDKAQMTNLPESLQREILCTERSGAYASTTLVGCNTRKYHGLLVVPIPELDDENHVLLASLDETVVQHGAEFNLGVHKYQGENFSPKGHKYIRSFYMDQIPTWIYRVGGVLLKKELLFQQYHLRLLVRYTLLEAHSPTKLQLKPFLAFRSVRQFTHENQRINRTCHEIPNGIRMCLYNGYPDLFMQTNTPNDFHPQGDWYRGFDYTKERERGYESNEDLYVPGFFETTIKKGESVIFTAGIHLANPAILTQVLEKEVEEVDSHDTPYHSLTAAAHQFHLQNYDPERGQDNENYLIAGYPWFKCRARDMFIALPGLTLTIGEVAQYEAYMATAEKAIRAFLCGMPSPVKIYEVEKPDVLLWAVWALQQYAKSVGKAACLARYGDLLQDILHFIRGGKHPNLFVHENGLLYSNGREEAITWMNALANGKPITPRSGYIVEFNALWYNALLFVADLCGDIALQKMGEQVAISFKEVFLNEYGYLLDYVDGNKMDWSVRPNMLFAIALDYSPLNLKEKKGVLDFCTRELLTPKGIRSLSPKSGGYNPIYSGLQADRDYAYHNGTAWAWLTGFYADAYLKVYRMSAFSYIERQLIGFEEEQFNHCMGTISEVFDGNPPFKARGAISFAMNVAGILRTVDLVEKNKQREEGGR